MPPTANTFRLKPFIDVSPKADEWCAFDLLSVEQIVLRRAKENRSTTCEGAKWSFDQRGKSLVSAAVRTTAGLRLARTASGRGVWLLGCEC